MSFVVATESEYASAMDLNWLYGPPATRSYRLDLDAIREIGQIVKGDDPQMFVTYSVDGVREVQLQDLQTLSLADLNRLTVSGFYKMAGENTPYVGPIISVSLGRASSSISAMLAPRPDGSSVEDSERVARIRRVFTDSSRPLVRKPNVRPARILVWFPFAIGLGAWVWLELSTALVPAVHLIGWAGVVLAFLVTRPLASQFGAYRTNHRYPQNGHIVIAETRKETAARRADGRRDRRVALLSGAVTLLATVLAAVILFFTLGPGH